MDCSCVKQNKQQQKEEIQKSYAEDELLRINDRNEMNAITESTTDALKSFNLFKSPQINIIKVDDSNNNL